MNKEEIKNIVNKCDHTNLKQDAKWSDIVTLCEDAIKYGAASVCIPPAYVSRVKETFGNDLKICTVIGFPNGYSTTEVKYFETKNAIDNGADEIDMVINIGDAKNKEWTKIQNEIFKLAVLCHDNDKILKVIIETCLLTDEEKETACGIITLAGADYAKTSTGFSTGGATIEDVKLMTREVDKFAKVKAAGGISSLEDAKAMIDAGAERLGTSRVINLIKENNML